MKKEHTEFVEVDAQSADGHAMDVSALAPDVIVMGMTWLTFMTVLIILHKFAWKPILSALDMREGKIKKSLEDAETIQISMAKLNAETRQKLDETETTAREILDEARKGAIQAARHIEDKAREESQILIENARREIKGEQEKATRILRQESAQIAVELAGKIIDQNLDPAKSEQIVNEFIKKLDS